MSELCINPTGIQEGDLMAYVDGIADETVSQHIRQCPACARQIERLAQSQAILKIKLYRFSCPASEQLIAYREGKLGGSEKLVVSQHIRQCPHCAQDLAALVRGERAGLGELIHKAFKILEATLVTPQVQTVGVRGTEETIRAPRVYRADKIEVIIDQRPSQTLARQWDLSGLVHVGGLVPDTVGTAAVELYRGEGLIALAEVNSRGQFSFPDVESANYDLLLVWEDQEIWLKGVQVQ